MILGSSSILGLDLDALLVLLEADISRRYLGSVATSRLLIRTCCLLRLIELQPPACYQAQRHLLKVSCTVALKGLHLPPPASSTKSLLATFWPLRSLGFKRRLQLPL